MQSKGNLKDFIPLGLLSIVGIGSAIQVLFTDYIFEPTAYVGLTLLAVCAVLFFLNLRWYRYAMGFVLIIGTLGLVSFSTVIMSVGIGFLQFHLIPLVVLIVFASIYNSRIPKAVHSLLGTYKTEEEIKELTRSRVDSFKRTFKDLSDSEIDRRLQTKLVPEALQALDELKKERNNTPQQPLKSNA